MPLQRLRTQLDRAGYLAQHNGLALSLGLLLRAFHLTMQPSLERPPVAALKSLRKRFLDLLDADLENVERGLYPRSLLFQLPITSYLRAAPAAMIEGPRIVLRRFMNRYRDLPAEAASEKYPDYYKRNFHWQSDGWLSDRSARIYDLEVEVLFGGTADVMRRMAIPPAIEAAPEGVLDLGCGTGRLLAQLSRALPDAAIAGVDLSPHYLARARSLLGERVDLRAENAEATTFADGSFDAVTCIFLFLDLPGDARRNVAREAHRLLKPGGRFIVLDSAQPTDAPELAPFLDAFRRLYHEPYFKGYLRDDLTALMSEVGFESVRCEPAFVSKLVVATKSPRKS